MVLIWKTQGNNYTNLLKNGSPKNREFREILGDSDVGDFVMLVTFFVLLVIFAMY